MFKFKPLLRTVVWGGEKIAPYKGIATDQRSIGESWELSGVRGSESVVDGGYYDGWALPELIAELKADLVGRSVYERFGTEFPLLVKFIDARRDLSIQVHPDDALARARHGSCGKTEMWYVVNADRGAHLKIGFSTPMTPDDYEKAVANRTIARSLRDYSVRPGDLFFLPAGRVHAICAGTFIAEIQQTSDITYRIYDYDRPDTDGKLRPLHTELAKEAIDFTVLSDYRTHYTESKNRETTLVACSHFTTTLYDLDRPVCKTLDTLDSFLVVTGISGRGTLRDDRGDEISIRQGETVLIAASSQWVRFTPDEALKLLIAHL